jgi:hypothetical protein
MNPKYVSKKISFEEAVILDNMYVNIIVTGSSIGRSATCGGVRPVIKEYVLNNSIEPG